MKQSLGKTGDYPNGKMNDQDEGGLKIGVLIKDERVVVAFGTPVAWIGLDKQTAIKIANAILDKASEL